MVFIRSAYLSKSVEVVHLRNKPFFLIKYLVLHSAFSN